jgi:hypothetical protein
MCPALRLLLGVAPILLVGSLGASDAKVDLSGLVDKAAAESILGTTVKDPSPINVEGRDGYYSKCNYYGDAPGKLLILRVYQAAPGFDAAEELEHLHATSGLTKAVADLGDKAELASGSASGLGENVTMIYVVKGQTLVTVGLRGFDEDAAVEKVKTVAKLIVEHL